MASSASALRDAIAQHGVPDHEHRVLSVRETLRVASQVPDGDTDAAAIRAGDVVEKEYKVSKKFRSVVGGGKLSIAKYYRVVSKKTNKQVIQVAEKSFPNAKALACRPKGMANTGSGKLAMTRCENGWVQHINALRQDGGALPEPDSATVSST